jgi:hypothetical protein
MLAAGLTPRLQFGEILWRFLANAAGMAFYDADTQAAAQSALGRPLATFHTANDDPSINSYADVNFLRTRLYSYVAGNPKCRPGGVPLGGLRIVVADGRERS